MANYGSNTDVRTRRSRPHEPPQRTQGRRLSRAIRAEHHADAALLEGEVQAVQDVARLIG